MLTPRLMAIADSIDKIKTVADIGSDHAHLPIYLILNKKVEKAIVTDIKAGPANISKERIDRYGQANLMDIRLGYGLKVLKGNEADTIIIAGMGGLLILEIIEEDLHIARSANTLILQPMRDGYLLRKWLSENRFEIIDVEIVKEEEKFYEIIWAIPKDKDYKVQKINYIDDKLMDKKSPVLMEYINSKIKEYKTIIRKLEQQRTQSVVKRQKECAVMIEYYEEAKKWLLQNAE